MAIDMTNTTVYERTVIWDITLEKPIAGLLGRFYVLPFHQSWVNPLKGIVRTH